MDETILSRSKTPTNINHSLFKKYAIEHYLYNEDHNNNNSPKLTYNINSLLKHNAININNEQTNDKAQALNVFPNKSIRYIVLDTETTGLDVNVNHLVSINAIEVINCQITGIQYHAYIRPRNKPNQASKYNSYLYYLEDYANERYDNAKASLKDFLRFVGNDVIVTHNALYDIKFINKSLKENGLPLIDLSKCVCSLRVARLRRKQGLFKNCSDLTVKSLCEFYDVHIKEVDYHHGIVDAVALARVVCKMMENGSNWNNSNNSSGDKASGVKRNWNRKGQDGNRKEGFNNKIGDGEKKGNENEVYYKRFNVGGNKKKEYGKRKYEDNKDKKEEEEFSVDLNEINKELENLDINDNEKEDSNEKGKGKKGRKYNLRNKGKKGNKITKEQNKDINTNTNTNLNSNNNNNYDINEYPTMDNNIDKYEMKMNLKNLLKKSNVEKYH